MKNNALRRIPVEREHRFRERERSFREHEHRFRKKAKSVHNQSESAFTYNQNKCSRSPRMGVHVKPEWVFILSRNMHFEGTLQFLPNFALAGSTRVDNLTLIQVEPYLRQFINVRLDSGTLSLNGQIHKDAQQPFAFQGAAGIEALNIRDGSNDEPLIGWQSIQTKQLDLSFAEKQLEAGPVTIDGLSGLVVIYEDRTTNFAQLMATPRADSMDNDDDTTKEPAPFEITIARIELSDGPAAKPRHRFA